MPLPIAIIAGEPNSISSEIIFKIWKSRKKNKYVPFFIIGSHFLLTLQKNKLKHNISIKKIDKKFTVKTLKGNKLPLLNVEYKQKKAFQKISKKSNSYIFECFDIAKKLIKEKKIKGFINCPIAKETLLGKKYQGITEFLATKSKKRGNEVMLLFNRKLSVSPLTTHIPIKEVSKKINKSKIIKKIKIIDNFYKKNFSKKPKIAILGLNPHNYSFSKQSEEKNIILPAIKALKKLKINVIGPISPDASFVYYKTNKIDLIFGMYHDQVLTSFKALFEYNAINITLGLPYIRVSPDHGVASNIIGKNIANPKSLMESIKFFNLLKK